MARILYGVAGEGYGHSSRAKEIIEHLIKKGHVVKVISYGKGYEALSASFDVEEIFGLRFSYKNNEVRYLKTALRNFMLLPRVRQSVLKVIKLIDEFKLQIVFTDFEPVSCIAANIRKLPLISIDNQHGLTRTKIEYPKKYKKDANAAMLVTKMIAFNAKEYMITDFYHGRIIKKKTSVFPPIVGKDIMSIKPQQKDFILVYSTSSSENLPAILKKINEKFVMYGYGLDKKDKNLQYKKSSRKEFIKDLSRCKGVIATAGLTLISEALYLRKPYLAIPIKGQFEQALNAYNLEKQGYGRYYEALDREKTESFLYNLSLYKKKLKEYKREGNLKIFKKVDSILARIKR